MNLTFVSNAVIVKNREDSSNDINHSYHKQSKENIEHTKLPESVKPLNALTWSEFTSYDIKDG